MFYIPRRRCGKNPGGVDAFALWFTKSATMSSIKTNQETSKVVYNHFDNLSAEDKQAGNTIKHGSGGNSYDNYMMRKKGNILCVCNVEQNIHS
jgi:hypothetical protein